MKVLQSQQRDLGWKVGPLAAALLAYSGHFATAAESSVSASDKHPVIVTANLSKRNVAAGDQIKATIRVTMDKGWHIYAYDPTYTFIVTEYDARFPDGVSAAGDWQLPRAKPYYADPSILIFEGDARFVRPLQIAEDIPPGASEVKMSIKYQTCNPNICLPPETITRTLTLTVF